uniref:Helitron helicase-like domain-containing protein n=1 Tax=Ananas comosus var. bracteatus TaxID=296719 RepID=A0A6V7Q8T9_ANACO|nr:unnamed protein product [Ananas comosus var. bracteatus]
MIQNYQDAIAICRHCGPPDLFITFTCNAQWPEIRAASEFIPGQKAEDRPDIVSRMFKLKLEALMEDIKKRRYFGKSVAELYTVEFQKRGLPHVHMLIWLQTEHKYSTTTEINAIILAEIPDQVNDPVGYAAVAKFMVHGPCGLAKPSAPCMIKSLSCPATAYLVGFGHANRSPNGQVTMPITCSQSAGADDAANFEEVETSATSGSSEVRELRGQLAALTDLVTQQAETARQQTEAAHRQEARMKRPEDLLLQQAAASRETQAPTPPAPVVDVAPRAPSPAPSSSRVAPVAAPQEEVLVAPPVQRPPVGAAFPTLVEGAERDRLMERLNEFRRCSPRVFDGKKVDHWIVEKWLMHMEKLFRDTTRIPLISQRSQGPPKLAKFQVSARLKLPKDTTWPILRRSKRRSPTRCYYSLKRDNLINPRPSRSNTKHLIPTQIGRKSRKGVYSHHSASCCVHPT